MADHQAQADPNAVSPLPAPTSPDLSAALPDAGSSSTTQPNTTAPNTAPAVDLDKVGDGDAYRAALDAVLGQPEPEPQGQPATEPASQETQPSGTTQPANETTTEPPTGTEPAEDDTRVPDRIRLGGLPEKDRALISAAALLAKAEGIPVTEAMARLAPKPAEPGNASSSTAQQADPIQPIRDKIAEVEKQLDAAATDADTVKMHQLNKELRELDRQLIRAENTQERVTQQAQVTAEQQFLQQVDVSRQKARDLYPALKDKTSPISQKWLEVAARLEANQDPLVTGNNPNFALTVAQMAAAELGVAPAAPAARTAAAPKSPPPANTPNPQPTARPVQPAPGSAKSTAPANPTGQLESRLAGVKSTEDYESLTRELLGAVA